MAVLSLAPAARITHMNENPYSQSTLACDKIGLVIPVRLECYPTLLVSP